MVHKECIGMENIFCQSLVIRLLYIMNVVPRSTMNTNGETEN